LAIDITLRCIKFGIRLPDGLLLAYPGLIYYLIISNGYHLALNLSSKCFSPSLLMALDDQIVPFTFLKMCLKLYLSDERCKPEADPFISPILASPEVFKV
jgi:hormone-sensitive lipase